MLGQLIALWVLIHVPTAETQCRAFAIDYSVDECDGLDTHLAARGIPNHQYYLGPFARTYRESAACLADSKARGGSPDLDCEIWEDD